MKKILVDYIEFKPSSGLIKESIKENNKLILIGKLQSAEVKNQNGRIYPKKILERELEKYKQLINERRALGELDHPDSAVVNLHNVSHLILDAWWEGNDIIGKIEVLNTPAGNILKNLIEADVLLGISSRGLGSVVEIDREGTVMVEDDFELIAWDFVSNPSTHRAFMRPLNDNNKKINESIELNSKIICRDKVECLIRDILTELNKK